MPSPHEELRAWAQQYLNDPRAVILDTETTGLDLSAEICQVAVISAATGEVLLDTLVKPTRAPQAKAAAIHGLTMERLADAPGFAVVAVQLQRVLTGATVLIYNVAFDMRLLEQSMLHADMEEDLGYFNVVNFVDVMQPYSEWVGEWSDYHRNYRYQKLPGGDHSALGDCRATRTVLQRMATTAEQPTHS